MTFGTVVTPDLSGSAFRAAASARIGSSTGRRLVDDATSTNPVRPLWEQVVTQLVAERGPTLQRYAFLLCGNTDDAADLVQDALVKTFGRLRNGFTVTSAEAYVRKAVLNTYLDGGRRRSRWRRVAHLDATPEAQDSESPTTELRLDLLAQLDRLSPRERACIVLRYYEDLKVDDIASSLGLSSGAVKRYLSDALARLAVSLTPPDAADKGGTHAHRI